MRSVRKWRKSFRISHQATTIRSYCDHCAVLRDGKLKYFDSVDAAAKEYKR